MVATTWLWSVREFGEFALAEASLNGGLPGRVEFEIDNPGDFHGLSAPLVFQSDYQFRILFASEWTVNSSFSGFHFNSRPGAA